jgi:hypothetical protein
MVRRTRDNSIPPGHPGSMECHVAFQQKKEWLAPEPGEFIEPRTSSVLGLDGQSGAASVFVFDREHVAVARIDVHFCATDFGDGSLLRFCLGHLREGWTSRPAQINRRRSDTEFARLISAFRHV